jgi:hypothetical protein
MLASKGNGAMLLKANSKRRRTKEEFKEQKEAEEAEAQEMAGRAAKIKLLEESLEKAKSEKNLFE